jgi:dTDP-4-amino-4,6-dideoxygalactose transaminase
MNVPFLDLKAHHEPIREQLDAAIAEVIDGSAFAGGPFVAAFERDFAAYCGARYAIGVGNGTDALWFSLLALGVGPGDEVITSPSTFMATAEAISFCGARPVFVDIEERTFTIDPALLERAVTPRTKAIIPVHLFGQMADMDPILDISRRHGVPVIEDACQAHGARYKAAKYQGQRAGTFGVAGCFSFYPGKNLGAFGEGGAIVTNDAELDARLRVLRDHGQSRKYYHSHIGWNGRMDGIQGAVLAIKLKHLDAANARRRAHAQHYDKLLGTVHGVMTPRVEAHNEHVFHIYGVRVQERDRMLKEMASLGISCAIHYPVPVHLQEAYRSLGHSRGAFPVAEKCADEFLSLPMYPELSEAQVRAVADALKACVTSDRRATAPTS